MDGDKTKSKKIDEKFGLVMVGRRILKDKSSEMVIVAPYTEGRFSDSNKVYTVAKGDPQTNNKDLNCNNEFREETGIDLGKLRLGLYGNARIIGIINDLNSLPYPSNSGRPTILHLKAVIVDNIDDIANCNIMKGQNLQFKTAKSIASSDKTLPTFSDFLLCLREGRIRNHPVGNRILNQIEEEKIVKQLINKDICLSEEDFDILMKDEKVKNRLYEDFKSIRDYLNEENLIQDDTGLKFDDKIRPLRYFQEGAEIISFEEYKKAIINFSDSNIGYKRSMLGHPESGFFTGQIHAVINAIEKSEEILSMINLSKDNFIEIS